MIQMLNNSDTRVRRTQAERREDSERGLIRAAIAVTAEQGVSAATFEAIGERGGYSRSLVTRRFGSKQGLIDAVVSYLHDRRAELAAEHGFDRMSGLEALLADAGSLRTAFATAHEQVRTRLRHYVQRGQAEGCIRPDLDADAAALMVGSLQLGLSMQLLVDPTMNLDPIRKTSLATLRISFEARR